MREKRNSREPNVLYDEEMAAGETTIKILFRARSI